MSGWIGRAILVSLGKPPLLTGRLLRSILLWRCVGHQRGRRLVAVGPVSPIGSACSAQKIRNWQMCSATFAHSTRTDSGSRTHTPCSNTTASTAPRASSRTRTDVVPPHFPNPSAAHTAQRNPRLPRPGADPPQGRLLQAPVPRCHPCRPRGTRSPRPSRGLPRPPTASSGIQSDCR